jgi:hypothetical protein
MVLIGMRHHYVVDIANAVVFVDVRGQCRRGARVADDTCSHEHGDQDVCVGKVAKAYEDADQKVDDAHQD